MTGAVEIKKAKIAESFLSQVWRHQLISKEALQASSGEKVQVIHPGWQNNDRGPDFRHALIALSGGRLLRGDVELHITAKGWREHGHDRDPHYDGVILHVVMWEAGEGSTLLHNGKRVPTLVLHPYLKGSLEELHRALQLSLPPCEPCHQALERLGAEALGELLDAAGEERFHSKAEQFKRQLAAEEAGQVLYEGIMGALGYAKNTIPLEELARRLPLCVLMEFALSPTSSERVLALQALLLGIAGLLPKQRCEKERGDGEWWARELEHRWESFDIDQTMSPAEWSFFRIRPENFPTRRIAAASYLLVRHGEEGLLQSVSRAVSQAHSRQGCRRLEQEFIVTAGGYWANHFDFGVEAWGNHSLVGQERAREIVVNILLPFCFAWAEMTSQPGLEGQALEIYRGYPRLGENRVTRYMERQIFSGHHLKSVDSACRQQGLIHLYKVFCLERRCHECALGVSLA